MTRLAKPIFITMGEPAGVGMEIARAAWQALRHDATMAFCLHCDPDCLPASDVPTEIVDRIEYATAVFGRALPVLRLKLPQSVSPGKPSPANVSAIADSIAQGVDLFRAGKIAAMVTNPICKSVMADGGFSYPGHTEYLAHLCGGAKPVMMLTNPQLRVVPMTVHRPVASVASHITVDLIIETAKITHNHLQKFHALPRPRIAFAGLNPHAGENGHIGREEIEIFAPAIAALRRDGFVVSNPLSADTLFHPDARRQYDIAICAYHDQALIPVKTIDFWNTVNVTMGLDLIRTSPDHGTALDIAGKGVANANSMIRAIKLAAEMAACHDA